MIAGGEEDAHSCSLAEYRDAAGERGFGLTYVRPAIGAGWAGTGQSLAHSRANRLITPLLDRPPSEARRLPEVAIAADDR